MASVGGKGRILVLVLGQLVVGGKGRILVLSPQLPYIHITTCVIHLDPGFESENIP